MAIRLSINMSRLEAECAVFADAAGAMMRDLAATASGPFCTSLVMLGATPPPYLRKAYRRIMDATLTCEPN